MGSENKTVELHGWVREGDGPWKPAPGHRIIVVDSGWFPMFVMPPNSGITIDLNKFLESAQRFRKPKPENVERDASIMELWNNGKTEGEILQTLKRTYPKLTLHAVKSVLRRLRDLGMLKPHPRKQARN